WKHDVIKVEGGYIGHEYAGLAVERLDHVVGHKQRYVDLALLEQKPLGAGLMYIFDDDALKMVAIPAAPVIRVACEHSLLGLRIGLQHIGSRADHVIAQPRLTPVILGGVFLDRLGRDHLHRIKSREGREKAIGGCSEMQDNRVVVRRLDFGYCS